jgi:hypothetical protein
MAEHTIFPSLLEDRGDDEANPTPSREQTPEEAFDMGRCPWCEDYQGDNSKQHAAKAHSEQYREWRED